MKGLPPVVAKIGIVALAVGAAIAPIAPATVERWFSTGLYPALQRLVTPVSNLAPFAVLDVLALGGCVAVVLLVVRAVLAARRTRRMTPILRAAGDLAAAGAFVYLAFLVSWGLNYRRVPLAERLVMESGAPASQAVVDLGVEAATQLNALHDEAHASGWRETVPAADTFRAAFVSAQRALSDAPPAAPGRLKRTFFGPYFRWAGVEGMINPLGLEVLANPDLLPFEIPFVTAHEWSHLAGYADEAEANFVGWLTCMRGDVATRYSGWLFLYWQASGEMDDEGRARLANALGAEPRADIEAVVERQRRSQVPWLRTAGWRVYDQYLKANRVEEGVRSYGAVVTLILRARFEPGWTPIRRR